VNKYKNEFILYNSLQINNNDNFYAINKSWIKIWKEKVNYISNIYNIIKIKNLKNIISLSEIKNKDILYDINSFLNDGNKESIDNKILKESKYEIISQELWDSFKEYGFDEEIDSKIINYNKNIKSINLVFNFKNEKEKKYKTKVYIDDEKNLIKKIVNCLNLKNNDI
jgi:hypothetical protein